MSSPIFKMLDKKEDFKGHYVLPKEEKIISSTVNRSLWRLQLRIILAKGPFSTLSFY